MANAKNKVANWRRQQSIDIGANCACFATRKAARAITQLYDRHLAPLGLRITQFTILNAIAGFRQVKLNRLADELVMDRTTLTRNLRPLIEADLVVSTPDPNDKRARLLGLTKKGEQTLIKALPLWRAAQTEFTQKVGGDVWARLSDNLRAVERSL